MNGSHLAGAGVGALVGAILVSLGSRIGLDLTAYDAATLGMAAVAAGLAIGHAIGEFGLFGIGRILLYGRRKPSLVTAVAALTSSPPEPPTT